MRGRLAKARLCWYVAQLPDTYSSTNEKPKAAAGIQFVTGINEFSSTAHIAYADVNAERCFADLVRFMIICRCRAEISATIALIANRCTTRIVCQIACLLKISCVSIFCRRCRKPWRWLTKTATARQPAADSSLVTCITRDQGTSLVNPQGIQEFTM